MSYQYQYISGEVIQNETDGDSGKENGKIKKKKKAKKEIFPNSGMSVTQRRWWAHGVVLLQMPHENILPNTCFANGDVLLNVLRCQLTY